MKLYHFSTLAAAGLLLFSACQQTTDAPADLDQIKTEIQALEDEWSAALRETNSVIADMGYANTGYFLYKTEGDEPADYRYFFEGVWPSPEVYTAVHENPAWIAASEKSSSLYEKIKAVELYRRVNLVE